MSGRLIGPLRWIAIVALIGVNVLLVGLILDKQGWPPFGDDTDAGQADGSEDASAPTSSTPDAGADSATTEPGDEADSGPATGAEAATETEPAVDLGVDDWPGGRGPVPDGPPVPRLASLAPDGTMTLTGSAPSWAIATEIARFAELRLPSGQESIAIDYTWHPQASSSSRSGKVSMDPAVLFDAGETALPDDAVPALDLVASVMSANPTIFVLVIAHTDDLGATDENAAVAFARAAAVVDFLVARGANRSQLVLIIAGSDEPVASNDTEDGRRFNRRVEIQFENFLTPSLVG